MKIVAENKEICRTIGQDPSTSANASAQDDKRKIKRVA